MKHIKLFGAIAIATLSTTGYSVTPSQNQHISTTDGVREVVRSSVVNRWDKTGPKFTEENLAAGESLLVFFRPVDVEDVHTNVNIGVDGDFHSSLEAGQYTTLTTCSGSHNLSGEITGAKNNNLEKQSLGLNLASEQVQYVMVTVDPSTNQTTLMAVDAPKAAQYISLQPRQTHQISRVQPIRCVAPVVQPVPAPPIVIVKPAEPKVFSLSADFLFDFDKSSLKPSAHYEIDKIVTNIRNEYQDVSAVQLVGHTDRMGSEAYNYDLALRRANTVKGELIKRGFNANSITVDSAGELQPVTDGCFTLSHEQAKPCLEPDRRVDIKVTGTLKN